MPPPREAPMSDMVDRDEEAEILAIPKEPVFDWQDPVSWFSSPKAGRVSAGICFACFCVGIMIGMAFSSSHPPCAKCPDAAPALAPNAPPPAPAPPPPPYTLPPVIAAALDSVAPDVAKIVAHSVQGGGRGRAWNRTAAFVDRFGHRLTGSQNLEDSLAHAAGLLQADGLENVRFEEVMVPRWERGGEACVLVAPLVGGAEKPLPVMAMGLSEGTGGGALEAEVVVVRDLRELAALPSAQVVGRIVVFDYVYAGYAASVRYRSIAAYVSKLGGVASLVRSVAPFSIGSPHTGAMFYFTGVVTEDSDLKRYGIQGKVPTNLQGDYANLPRIPQAALTIEDTAMLMRIYQRGETIRIRLTLGGVNYGMVPSKNVVGEIKGSTHPEQVIILGGHLDSWDFGQGAMDDAGPAFVAWDALSTLLRLGLRPKRTLRLVFWTAEEQGAFGGLAHYERHKAEQGNVSMVLELDSGIWNAIGVRLSGDVQTTAIAARVGAMLDAPLGAKHVVSRPVVPGSNGLGIDVDMWANLHSIPAMALAQEYNNVINSPVDIDGYLAWEMQPPTTQHFQGDYFFFHHTKGDTMEVLDPRQMDAASAVVAAHAYAVASLPSLLTRGTPLAPVAMTAQRAAACASRPSVVSCKPP